MYISKRLQILPTNSHYHSFKGCRTLKFPRIRRIKASSFWDYSESLGKRGEIDGGNFPPQEVEIGLPSRWKWGNIKRKRLYSIKIFRASFSVAARYLVRSFKMLLTL